MEFVKAFKKAREKEQVESKIICVDMSDTAPALYFGDVFYIVPPVSSPDYIDTIVRICEKEDVKMIIPTIDTELKVISMNKKLFEQKGIIPLISDINVVNICNDKLKTYQFFIQNNFNTPKTYRDASEIESLKFPYIIKPRYGSSSINTFKAVSEEELNFFKKYVPDSIIQEFIEGEEYSIDIFCDFNATPIYITPRKRLAVRSGEISKGITVRNSYLINECERLVEILKPVGGLTVQVIKKVTENSNCSNDEYYFIEINARFGGGCPISFSAGADATCALYKLLKGERVISDFYSFKENLLALRFDEAIYVENYDGKWMGACLKNDKSCDI